MYTLLSISTEFVTASLSVSELLALWSNYIATEQATFCSMHHYNRMLFYSDTVQNDKYKEVTKMSTNIFLHELDQCLACDARKFNLHLRLALISENYSNAMNVKNSIETSPIIKK